MTKRATLGFALLLVLCVVQADIYDDGASMDASISMEVLKRLTRNALDLPTHPGVEKALKHGRRLAQRRRSIQSCTWDTEEAECRISEEAEIDLFSRSNNPDAEYFSDHLLCDNLLDQESCYDAGCLWDDNERCTFGATSREIANCFRNATLYLHRSQRDSLCGGLRDASECEASSQCNWDEDLGYCDLDYLYTLTSVPSEDGRPEGFSEVYGLMRREAYLAFNEEYPTHRSLVNNLEDVAQWTLPRFECPREFDQIVCDFAARILETLPTSIYCDAMYGRDWDACDEDDMCGVLDGERTRQCAVSDEELERAVHEANLLYINSIHDPFIRDIYAMQLNCSQHDRIPQCESALCAWRDDEGCTVSNVQLRNAYLAEIDDDAHPVCHVFVVSDRYGCEDLYEYEDCARDEHCSWDEYEMACYPSEQAIVAYILENDRELEDEFEEIAQACERQRNRRACLNY